MTLIVRQSLPVRLPEFEQEPQHGGDGVEDRNPLLRDDGRKLLWHAGQRFRPQDDRGRARQAGMNVEHAEIELERRQIQHDVGLSEPDFRCRPCGECKRGAMRDDDALGPPGGA